MREELYIKYLSLILITVFLINPSVSFGEWTVDFSRRVSHENKSDYVLSPSKVKKSDSVFDMIFAAPSKKGSSSELVILLTDKGFIPSTLNVQEFRNYKIHVVNVDKKNKNVSFVFDSFSEFHSIYYGTIKTFYISPQEQGIYSFQCPETSHQGQVVVYKGLNKKSVPIERYPTSVE